MYSLNNEQSAIYRWYVDKYGKEGAPETSPYGKVFRWDTSEKTQVRVLFAPFSKGWSENWSNGESLHREDGPAVIRFLEGGRKIHNTNWLLKGKLFEFEEYLLRIDSENRKRVLEKWL